MIYFTAVQNTHSKASWVQKPLTGKLERTHHTDRGVLLCWKWIRLINYYCSGSSCKWLLEVKGIDGNLQAQPRSQGLSSYCPLEGGKKRDTGSEVVTGVTQLTCKKYHGPLLFLPQATCHDNGHHCTSSNPLPQHNLKKLHSEDNSETPKEIGKGHHKSKNLPQQ